MTALLTSVLAVLTAVSEWIVSSMETIVGLFYGTDGLTYFGILSIVGVAIAVCLLLINIIKSFLSFR